MKGKKAKKARGRDGIAVKSWMLKQGISQAEIVRSTKINKGLVSRTINGLRNCRKVLDYLKEQKIPERLLWKKWN
jgi:hypothetical protein